MMTMVATSISSCKKYLDVNTNPNAAISGTPDLVLPQAITAIANQTWAYNFYGAQTAGYLANGGGVSGWGAIISYNYASTDQIGLWNNSYDIATDVQYVIDNTEGITNWIKFANTLKLRLVLRAGSKVTFTNKTFDSIGFLTDDAVVNPGYSKTSGKQNPAWNTFAYTYAGAVVSGGASYVPTPYIMGFYNGTKLTDAGRIAVTYKSGKETPTNQLGNLLATAGRGISPNSWFIGTNSTSYASIGIFKGPDAPQPLLLLSDSYFLQAEGVMKGLITGDAKTYFDNGIQASFRYLYKNSTNAIASGKDPVIDGKAYQTTNSTNYLANYNLAVTDDQRLEAIITQKYIALNMLFGDEAWNEYRRTGYPANNASTSATPVQTINSIVSESTATDKLPARLQYPSTEFNYNAANVPTVDKYMSKIFWAK
ncbi:MAG: SusD/RagB family nutrient-binding outer membrane lipoprotein [Sphingobacteriaceae bacterium]|nr:MAG: SusD/RagB family nutrient-binding outer membrane lipoprotein [Sphingobacteriaceae bacterium]